MSGEFDQRPDTSTTKVKTLAHGLLLLCTDNELIKLMGCCQV
jgi:hypothetical protein